MSGVKIPPRSQLPILGLRFLLEVVVKKIPVVQSDECISCGLCVEICPEVFRLNDQDLSEVSNPTGAPEEKIQEAIDSCPVQCIHWKE